MAVASRYDGSSTRPARSRHVHGLRPWITERLVLGAARHLAEHSTARMKLVLPLPPNRANARMHWRAEWNKKSEYYAMAIAHIRQQSRPAARAEMAAQNVEVSATLYVWNKYDDDGAVSLLKWPLDSLKYAGVIHDDKRPHCALRGIPLQVVDRKRQRLELEITVQDQGER